MNLVIFDFDGTLTRTNEIDNSCYVDAFADSHKIFGIETDWAKYENVTDSGIAAEIFTERLGPTVKEDDFATFKNCFMKKLSDFAESDMTLFSEITNAKVMLEKLKFEEDWSIALATGCFYDSAKLNSKKQRWTSEIFRSLRRTMQFQGKKSYRSQLKRP